MLQTLIEYVSSHLLYGTPTLSHLRVKVSHQHHQIQHTTANQQQLPPTHGIFLETSRKRSIGEQAFHR